MLIDPPIEVESSCCESLVGLLTRASSTRSSLPRVSSSSGFRCSSSPRSQWRGPCRDRAGFPNKPDRQIYIPEHGKESSQTFTERKSHKPGDCFHRNFIFASKADVLLFAVQASIALTYREACRTFSFGRAVKMKRVRQAVPLQSGRHKDLFPYARGTTHMRTRRCVILSNSRRDALAICALDKSKAKVGLPAEDVST